MIKLVAAAVMTGLATMVGTPAQAADPVPRCRMDGILAGEVARTIDAAAAAYVGLGKPRLFDKVVVNPVKAEPDAHVLSVYIVADAAAAGVDASGCAKVRVGKVEPLDRLSVRGGCVAVAVEQPELRCSARAVQLFGDIQRPGRAHPALLYVLAHEIGHLYQKRTGEYAGRMESIDLAAEPARKLAMLRNWCNPVSTRREEEADAMAVQVLTRLLPAPPYREPLFSEQGSVYWGIDQLVLAADAWQQSAVDREAVSEPDPHKAFIPDQFPMPEAAVEANAKTFVCDVFAGRRGTVLYPARSTTHPPLEQRMRKVAEALKPIAAALPTVGAKQEFRPVAVLQEQVSPILTHIYRETGVYLEALQDNICTRVNGDDPTAGCR